MENSQNLCPTIKLNKFGCYYLQICCFRIRTINTPYAMQLLIESASILQKKPVKSGGFLLFFTNWKTFTKKMVLLFKYSYGELKRYFLI